MTPVLRSVGFRFANRTTLAASPSIGFAREARGRDIISAPTN